MALHYNLAKVYEISEDDDFAMSIVSLFVTEVPLEIEQIKAGIDERDYKKAYAHAHKIKPSLDILGMEDARQDVLQIEDWGKTEGKRKEIIEVYKSLENQVEKAVKELKKDFSL